MQTTKKVTNRKDSGGDSAAKNAKNQQRCQIEFIVLPGMANSICHKSHRADTAVAACLWVTLRFSGL
jgi:hypothetical protein